jgi:hypothetical protein
MISHLSAVLVFANSFKCSTINLSSSTCSLSKSSTCEGFVGVPLFILISPWKVNRYLRRAGNICGHSCHTSPPGGPKTGETIRSKSDLKVFNENVDWTKMAFPEIKLTIDVVTSRYDYSPVSTDEKMSPDVAVRSRRAKLSKTWFLPSPPQWGKRFNALESKAGRFR